MAGNQKLPEEGLLRTCVDGPTLGMVTQRHLKAELERRGLDGYGNKRDLIDRLIEDNRSTRPEAPENQEDSQERDDEELSDSTREERPELRPITVPQLEQGQPLEAYMVQLMGIFGNVLQQNQEMRNQQLETQRQMLLMNSRNIEIHTTPDLYLSIPEFYGRRTDNAGHWINIVERISTQQSWSTSTKLLTVTSRLRAEAKDWHDTLGAKVKVWSDWKELFLLHFSRRISMREWHVLVDECIQKKEEKLAEHFRAKLKIIDSGPLDITANDKIDLLVSGIRDRSTAHMLKLQHFEDVYELIEAAREIDQFSDLDAGRRTRDMDRPKIENNQIHAGKTNYLNNDRYSQITRETGSVRSPNVNDRTVYRRGMDKREATCFVCNKKGHLSFECDQSTKPRINSGNSRFETKPKKLNLILHSKEPSLPVVEGVLEDGNKVFALLDSGSEVSLIKECCVPNQATVRSWDGANELMVLGSTYKPKGLINVRIKISDITEVIPMCVVESTPFEVLLGSNWRQTANVKITLYPNRNVKIKRLTNTERNSPDMIRDKPISGCIVRVVSKASNLEIEKPDETYKPSVCPDVENELNYEINNVISKCDPEVSCESKHRLRLILQNHSNAFTTSERTLGCCPNVEHAIHLRSEVPVKSSPYRYSPNERKFISKTVEKWKDQGIVENSSSDYSSPVVIVNQIHHPSTPKRLCVNYSRLNDNTVKIRYPIPIMEDVIDKMVSDGSNYFNVLDIKTAFMNVKLRPEDKHKTAFVTQDGLYQFTRMPFGLCNAPSTMQKVMNKTYQQVERCATYMDDILQGGKTVEHALDLLEVTLDRTIENGLLMDLRKCQILQKSVSALGYIITRDGKIPDPLRVNSVDKFGPFTNVKDVRSFVQFASHYRRFIKDFSRIANPLAQLLRKDVEFEWSDKQEEAVSELTRRLKEPPILGHFQPDCPTAVYVDASQTGLGAVLTQTQHGREIVIEFASRSVNDCDKKLHSNMLECMAVHWAVCEKFRIYLYGGPHFVIWTDNWSASYLMRKSAENRRFARWYLDLQEFEYSIKHLSGDKMLLLMVFQD